MSSGKSGNEVLKWIEFSVGVTSAIFYPINKTINYKKHLLDDTGGFDSEDERYTFNFSPEEFRTTEISKELGGYEASSSPSTLEQIGSIVKAVEKVFMFYRVFKMIKTVWEIDNRENEMEIFGIKIRKHHLTKVKLAIIGIAVVTLVMAAIPYFLGKISDKLVEKIMKVIEVIQVILNVIMSIIGVVYLGNLIWDLINNRKSTLGYWTNVNYALNMAAGFLDIKAVEKRLAKNPKAYAIITGIFTVSKLSYAYLNLIRKDETGLKLREDHLANGKDNVLFVYFCGTDESTKNQHFGFLEKIEAKHHLYFSGLDAKTFEYKQMFSSELKPSDVSEKSKDLILYTYKHEKRNVTFIEKQYAGSGASGFINDDSESVASEALAYLEQYLKNNPQINKIIFSGHSRGAAAGLSSFLYKVKDSDSFRKQLAGKCITNFFLDPVSGQTGNNYHMDENWNTGKLYNDLYQHFGKNMQFIEVYARAASFLPIPGLKSFNPARKFLHNPKENTVYLARFIHGYTHSGLICDYFEYSDPYHKSNMNSPFTNTVNLINSAIQSDFSDRTVFINKTKETRTALKKSDADSRLINTIKPSNMREGTYKNQDGVIVIFSDFIESYTLE